MNHQDELLNEIIAGLIAEYPVTAILKALSVQLDIKFGKHPEWQAGLAIDHVKEMFRVSGNLLKNSKKDT